MLHNSVSLHCILLLLFSVDDIEGPFKPTIEEPQRKSRSVNLLDTLRFEEEEDYEDEINLKFFFFAYSLEK